MIEVFSAPIGAYGTNCYIIKDKATALAAAVDCAVFNRDYERLLDRAGVKRFEYILLTHGHFDHICGVAELKRRTGGKVCISERDAECLTDEYKSFNAHLGSFAQESVSPDILLHDGSVLTLGETSISVISTPGHTPGSVCFYADGCLFSGDTLFYRSVGRTDLGGNAEELINSLKKLTSRFDDARVYPGHGTETSLLFEKNNNPFLR